VNNLQDFKQLGPMANVWEYARHSKAMFRRARSKKINSSWVRKQRRGEKSTPEGQSY